jgi:hypothetical protein
MTNGLCHLGVRLMNLRVYLSNSSSDGFVFQPTRI